MAKPRVRRRVYDCAKGPCPHSTKTEIRGSRAKGDLRFRYSPGCCKAYCDMCGGEIKRGEAWTHIPAIGVMHRRKCNPDGWTVRYGDWAKVVWRSHG